MPTRRALVALAALVMVAAGCARSGVVIDKLDMRDLPVPVMFAHVANAAGVAYVVELPTVPSSGRFDLKLEHVRLEKALDAMDRLDPAYRHEEQDGVIALWPTGQDDAKSPFKKEMDAFSASAGLADVLRTLLVQSGLSDTTELSVALSGLRRPVTIDVHHATVREILVSVAKQGHVAIRIEPGRVDVNPVGE